jgi:hypothetical protein
MYYIFNQSHCIGAYSYEPQVDSDVVVIQSEEEYSKLSELQLRNGKIVVVKSPKPPQIIDIESYSPETVELYQAIAGLYELVEKGEQK